MSGATVLPWPTEMVDVAIVPGLGMIADRGLLDLLTDRRTSRLDDGCVTVMVMLRQRIEVGDKDLALETLDLLIDLLGESIERRER